jgi:hypothetical protein
MTYKTQNEIAESIAMRNRIAQAVAAEGPEYTPDPDSWTFNQRRYWAAAPGWDAAWESYRVGNPGTADPGLVESVITDQMILSQVQSMAPTPPEA